MAEPSSSFRLSSQITFRDPWPSVVGLYGASVAKLEMCSSEFSLCNSRIGWVTRQDVSVWGVEGRSKLARFRFFLELKGLSKAHPAATHWCFSSPASLTSSWALDPQEHQLLLTHLQLLWLLSQVCVLLCDKGWQILQGSPILAIGSVEAVRGWIPVHPHEFLSVLWVQFILPGSSVSLLPPLCNHLLFPPARCKRTAPYNSYIKSFILCI